MIKNLTLVPYTFVLMNWAAMMALFHFLHSHGLEDVWVDSRRGGGARPRSPLPQTKH